MLKVIKVLLVDDNDIRARTLYSSIETLNDVKIDTATTKKDALLYMENTIYDLVIIDVMLPENMSTIHPSKTAGIELINDIESLHRIKKPYHIVGITSEKDIYDSVKDFFESKLIPIFIWNPVDNPWQNWLINKISYIKKVSNQEPISINVEVAILTAVDDEFEAVKTLIAGWEVIELDDDPNAYLINTYTVGGVTKKVLLAQLSEMGMTAASCTTTKIIKTFSPKKIYMVGICGGVRGKVDIGDIIVASNTWDYGSGKIKQKKDATTNGYYDFEASPNHISSSVSNIDNIKLLTESLLSEVTNAWNKEHRSNPIMPKIHIAPMPSGASVICDETLFNEVIRPQHRKCVAIDMETYGVYFAATKSTRKKINFLSIKCVSDYADKEKNDDYHESCCFTSANFLFKCISKGIL